MDGPDDLFAEVVLAMIDGRAPDPMAREWFVRQSLVAIRRDETLDTALGLAGPGLPTFQRRLQKLRRDAALSSALHAVSLDPAATRWQRCTRLAPLVRRFMADAWPAVKRQAEPPTAWPAWKKALFWAAKTGLTVPASATGLRAAVLDTPTCSLRAKRATMLAQYI